MNFGEKLKRIRTEKNLTQPQFAEAIGIEQSYLSKLENDKSQPSADMFSAILKALELDAANFLADIDKKVLQTSLRHVPEVGLFLNGATTRKVHDARKYWYGAAAAGALGFALMLAANDGIFFPNNQYRYLSHGVILDGESENIFEQFEGILALKLEANAIDAAERARQLAEFKTERVRVATVEFWGDRGTVFFEPAGNGRRKFEQINVRHMRSKGNKILHYLGAVLAVCGLMTLVVGWRMRKATAGIEKPGN